MSNRNKIMTTPFDVSLWDCGSLTWTENKDESVFYSCAEDTLVRGAFTLIVLVAVIAIYLFMMLIWKMIQ